MTDLRDYSGDGTPQRTHDEPPSLMLTGFTECIRAPGKGGKIAGYTGIDHNRGRAYLTIRKYSKHYYRKGKGYAISTSIIGRLQGYRCEHIFVWDAQSEKTYVFQVNDYARGEDVPTADRNGPDEQKYVPLSTAREVWKDQSTCPMVDIRPGGTAAEKKWGDD